MQWIGGGGLPESTDALHARILRRGWLPTALALLMAWPFLGSSGPSPSPEATPSNPGGRKLGGWSIRATWTPIASRRLPLAPTAGRKHWSNRFATGMPRLRRHRLHCSRPLWRSLTPGCLCGRSIYQVAALQHRMQPQAGIWPPARGFSPDGDEDPGNQHQ